MSMTQYTAGGLFRWVEQGFWKASDLEKADKEGKKEFDARAKEHWNMGLELFSSLDELKIL
jgi:hypothetical protein